MFSSNSSQVSSAANFVEDVFSTWLYTGNGSTQTINNGIDLAGKGGLVWMKGRNNTTDRSHNLVDTARGSNKSLFTNLTNAEATATDRITSFNSDGFGLGSSFVTNENTFNYVSWTFRKQPKFFDVVTWTGDGNTSKTIPHSLGSVPGCIITKMTSGVNNWQTYHRSLGNTQAVQLNLTNAAGTNTGFWNNTSPTATEFTVGTVENANGETYVAYLFAHDAGGFGLTGTDNVISCGSFNYSPAGTTVNLGYEPQYLLIKSSSQAGDWLVFDNMRGMPGPSTGARYLMPNSSNAEAGFGPVITLSATGFRVIDFLTGGADYIYIAIRRGPMKTPTTGTSVFYAQAVPQGNIINSTGVPFPPDLVNTFSRNGTDRTTTWQLFNYADRLRGLGVPNNTYTGSGPVLSASSTAAEDTSGGYVQLMADSQNINRASGWNDPMYGNWIYYFMRRAPGFFDVVCYTGNDAGGRTISHNLGVAPEMMLVKCRSAVGRPFGVYSANVGAAYAAQFDSAGGFGINASYWNNTNPTATVFTVGTSSRTNTSGETYVAYLFASCPGVSKVGSYTGTGALQTIDCGFTGGARWVMIKRSDGTGGDWYVYDSARGITSGNDPYLLLNSNAAEVTGTNYVDTASTGFQVTAAAPAGLNANGGTYIYLAIS